MRTGTARCNIPRLALVLTSLIATVTSQGNFPRYACETAIEEVLFGSGNYRGSIVPIVSGDVLDVGIQMEAQRIQISNHGIDGGSVDVFGSLIVTWKDERLRFDGIDFNNTCEISSIQLAPEEIWVPELAGNVFETVHGPRVTLSSDGSALWRMLGSLRLACRITGSGLVEDPSKICVAELSDESGTVRYVSGGILVNDGVSIPEYRVNRNVSSAALDGAVQLELDFDPLWDDCNVCGHSDGALLDKVVKYYPEIWLDRFPHTQGWNCTQLDLMLQALNVSDATCLEGRAYFEETCCHDTRSSFDCERNIHQQLVEKNTVTPPDPSPQENESTFSSADMIDVQLQLDLVHVLGIDVKTNTLKVLAGLELAWYDQNLAWHPFIGGCHRVSYRASLDAEQTEIWVPEIELINLVEGVHELPDEHASVRYDGFVRWRRAGILTATCDLLGIEHFPFDETSCSLEFGGTRDPLYQRVNYVAPEGVQFGENLIDGSWNYQEYKVASSKTEVFTEIDELSGFENKVIHFQFAFKRAQSFYVNLFVVLYIIFTYLAFGMLFVDYRVGERLAYGSSILFVIVAQDITLAGSTPVTQEYLWIYKLSFGSKMFIVYSIVYSVVILYVYAHDSWEADKPIAEEGSPEEAKPFIGEGDGAANDMDTFMEDGMAIDEATQATLDNNNFRESSEIPSSRETASVDRSKKNAQSHLSSRPYEILCSFLCCRDLEELKSVHKLAYLRAVDLRMAIICIAAYTLFLIIMFTAGLS